MEDKDDKILDDLVGRLYDRTMYFDLSDDIRCALLFKITEVRLEIWNASLLKVKK